MIAFSCRVKFFRGRNKKSSFDKVIFKMEGESEQEVAGRVEAIAEFMSSGQMYGFYDMGKVTVSKPRAAKVPGEQQPSESHGRKRRASQA